MVAQRLLRPKAEGNILILYTYHGVEDVEVAHAPVAGHYVRGCVALWMTHVEPGTRGVGKHVQHVFLAFAWPPYCLLLLGRRCGGEVSESLEPTIPRADSSNCFP